MVTVTPTPYDQSPSLQTLKWLGTMSFGEGQPAIVLGERSSSGVMDFIDQNALSLAGVILAGGGFSAGFYVMRRYR